jgi:magnesium-transporting ATPase (P-type)
MCTGEATRDGTAPLDAPRWRSVAEAFAAEGLRVLAVAAREAPELEGELREADVDGRMILLGLVGLIDPPRPEAIEAVKRCRKAGIRVKMVTGDHLITARAIADAMGIGTHGSALSGADLEAMDDAELERVAPQVDVYARASPEHKLRLVAALQAGHQVLAMTGDGVNDAPALKRADVGVAMGRGGTEAAREAARMVLSDDNFASIASAVEEGRIVYDNIRKAIIYVLPTSIAEGLIVLAAILLGLPLPITPLQILWVNMITAVTLSLALAVEPAEGDVMQRPPRGPDEPLLDRLLVWRVAFVSAVLLGGVAALFAHATATGATLETARTIAVNALVMFEAFYLLSARHITAPVLNREGFFGNRVALAMVVVVVVLQLLMTYVPVMQQLFGTAPLAAVEWARLLAVSVLVVPLVEAEKLVVRRRTLRTSARHAGAPV